MRAPQIVRALLDLHPTDRWAVFPELRVGGDGPTGESRRADLWCIDTWPPSHFERVGYEVKTSRADYAAEVRTPEKRRALMLLTNRMYFAVPEGMIDPDELPLDCGLVTVAADERGVPRATVALAAPWRDVPPPTVAFLAELARRSMGEQTTRAGLLAAAAREAEQRMRRAAAEASTLGTQRDLLRSEVSSLRREVADLARQRAGLDGAPP